MPAALLLQARTSMQDSPQTHIHDRLGLGPLMRSPREAVVTNSSPGRASSGYAALPNGSYAGETVGTWPSAPSLGR